MDCYVSTEPIKDFVAQVEASGCYCEFEDKILILQRSALVPQGGTWGIPSGKHEKGEDARSAVIRELWEETQLSVEEGLQYLGKLYVRRPQIDYIFHVFRKRFERKPSIELRFEENVEARWLSYEEALELPLIAGGKEALHFYKRASKE
jgi:8-oxo-dGTP diphosphatase